MNQNSCLKQYWAYDDSGREDNENLNQMAHKARQETEAFVNSNIHDPKKGWPVRARKRGA